MMVKRYRVLYTWPTCNIDYDLNYLSLLLYFLSLLRNLDHKDSFTPMVVKNITVWSKRVIK